MGEPLRNGLQRVVDALQRILGGKTGTVENPHRNVGKVPVIGYTVKPGRMTAVMAAIPAAAAALFSSEKPLMIHKKFTAFSCRSNPARSILCSGDAIDTAAEKRYNESSKNPSSAWGH